jgi:hypothetical protein
MPTLLRTAFLAACLLAAPAGGGSAQDSAAPPHPPPDFVYVARDGYGVVEAEDLPHSDKWVELAEGNDYLGRGFLKWTGGVQGRGEDQKVDRTGRLQGDPKDWLVVPVKITKPGVYRVDLRNRHQKKDGDNDVWVHIVGWPLPVRRVGDHGVETYQWLTWGTDVVTFEIKQKGVYQFYVAGRSNNFGVDRIAVFHEDAPAKFRFRSHPVSRREKN